MSKGYRQYIINEDDCKSVGLIYENLKAYVDHIRKHADDFYDSRKSKFLFFKEKQFLEFNKERADKYVKDRGLEEFLEIKPPFMDSVHRVVIFKKDSYEPIFDVYPMLMLDGVFDGDQYCLLTPDQCEFIRRVRQGRYKTLEGNRIFDVFAYTDE